MPLPSTSTLSHSKIMTGWVRHRRLSPRAHEFRYQVMMMYLDLDEQASFFAQSPFWSDKRWALAQFRRKDYLGDASISLKQSIYDCILHHTGQSFKGRVRLLTNPRYFGFIINPISIYYCFDESEQLQFMVLEVTNTPWREKVQYVVKTQQGTKHHAQFAKTMHVSPFNPMDLTYHLDATTPEQTLLFHLATWQQQNCIFDATLNLTANRVNRSQLTRVLLSYPLMTLKVAAGIYWQALKLWCKKIPLHAHPAKK